MGAMTADSDPELDGLKALSIHELRIEWRRTFRRHPGPGLTRTLLIGMLAYQRQAEMHGDLSAKHVAFLDRVVARMARGSEGKGRRPLVPALPTNSMQPGTVLVREWNGKMEAVTVVEGGFLWGGMTHATLSAVANAITGRHWNGFAFFGLKAPAPRRPSATGPSEPAMPKKASAEPPSTVSPPKRRGRPPKVRTVSLEGPAS